MMILCSSLILLTLTACSSGPSPSDISKQFLKYLNEADYEKVAILVDKSDTSEIKDRIPGDDKSAEKIGKLMLSKFSYVIGESKIDGDKATVNVKVTSLDMLRIVSKTISEIMPLAFASAFSNDGSQDMDSLMEQYMLNSMSDPNAPIISTNTVINLVKTDKGWKVSQDNDELFNAITGNAMKAFANAEQATSKAVPKVDKTDYNIGEKIILFDGVELAVTKVEKSGGSNFEKPKAGREFIIAHINIVNGTKDTIGYGPNSWKIKYSNGQIMEQAFTMIDRDTHLESGELTIGGNVSGTISFEAPVDDQGLKLVYAPPVLEGQEILVTIQP